MITHSLVITDRDLPVIKKIMLQAVQESEYLADFYDKTYAEDIKKLNEMVNNFDEVINNPNLSQTVIEFSLYSIKIYKVLIFRYLKANSGQIDKKEMHSITSMLERLDWWIDEYLKADEPYLEEHIILKK